MLTNFFSAIEAARRTYHESLLRSIFCESTEGIPSNSDKDSPAGVTYGTQVLRKLRIEAEGTIMGKPFEQIERQVAKQEFQRLTVEFLRATFLSMRHLRPGRWDVLAGDDREDIARDEQYAHLLELERAVRDNANLAVILGSDYVIRPDILVVRETETEAVINSSQNLVGEGVAQHASLRQANGGKALLHASISCKWTLRSDRAQNARSEALNLIRSRKGRVPHIAIVTGEPTPARLASIALGTGDINCIYHFALPELVEAVGESAGDGTAQELLRIMIEGKRLKDIADLPLDLAI